MTNPTQLTPLDPTPPKSPAEQLMEWRQANGYEFVILAVSPWGKRTPIAFLLPDGFGADIEIVQAQVKQ